MGENRNNAGETLLVLLLGAVAGAAAGLLLAPRTGKETRRRVGRWLEDVEERGEDLIEGAEALWEKGKEKILGAPAAPPRKNGGN